MRILNLPLSRSNVDRSAHLRGDEAALEAMWESGRILHFNGEAFLTSGANLSFLTANEISGDGLRVYLGQHEGTHYFLWSAEGSLSVEESAYKTLREIGSELTALEIGLAVHGQGVALWHARNPFCSYCGKELQPALAGSVKRCENAHEQYPRTDPAIIVLIKDSDDRILLGRQGVWPEHRFSTFAGFVESGESFEQCVVREVFEEAGVHVTDIHYLGSQPWPFPQSLMIAFEATITDPHSARADGEEIVEIRWFSRDGLYQAMLDGTLLLPPSMSVARAMIQAWYGEDHPALPGSQSWRP